MKYCDKTRFPTEAEAKDVLAYIGRLAKHESLSVKPSEQRVYHCPECDGWHLTPLPR